MRFMLVTPWLKVCTFQCISTHGGAFAREYFAEGRPLCPLGPLKGSWTAKEICLWPIKVCLRHRGARISYLPGNPGDFVQKTQYTQNPSHV
jgi:hypothetical protein